MRKPLESWVTYSECDLVCDAEKVRELESDFAQLQKERDIAVEALEKKNLAHKVTYGVDCPICSEALKEIREK